MRKLVIVLMLLLTTFPIASARKLRVMSYNIHNCVGVDGKKSYIRCAEVINKVQADIVAIQELDSMTTRTDVYVLGELAKRSNYHDYYGKTIPYRGGSYGIGVLTKEPALSVEFHRLPCRKEPRGMLLLDMGKYYFIATHLSLAKEDQLASVEIIRNIVSKLDKPTLFAGDLNAAPHSATMNAFAEFMTTLNDTNRATFPTKKPRKCIDYILGCNGRFKTKRSEVIYDCIYSDHLPLYIDTKFSKSRKK